MNAEHVVLLVWSAFNTWMSIRLIRAFKEVHKHRDELNEDLLRNAQQHGGVQ